jgi:predicted transcriptional regulator
MSGGMAYAGEMTGKAMTIRLSSEQAEMLETVASVSNQPISEVIRAAIDSHINSVASDEGFQQGLRERIARAESLLRNSSNGIGG